MHSPYSPLVLSQEPRALASQIELLGRIVIRLAFRTVEPQPIGRQGKVLLHIWVSARFTRRWDIMRNEAIATPGRFL